MGGEARMNPTAIAAKKGEIPPKKKSTLSKRQRDRLMMESMYNAIKIPGLPRYY